MIEACVTYEMGVKIPPLAGFTAADDGPKPESRIEVFETPIYLITTLEKR
jgi:hypothetical protein